MDTSPRQIRRARLRLASELALYDTMQMPPKLRRIAPLIEDTSEAFGPNKGYVCGHAVSLCLPCTKCKRSSDDCVVYVEAHKQKIKELLK